MARSAGRSRRVAGGRADRRACPLQPTYIATDISTTGGMGTKAPRFGLLEGNQPRPGRDRPAVEMSGRGRGVWRTYMPRYNHDREAQRIVEGVGTFRGPLLPSRRREG